MGDIITQWLREKLGIIVNVHDEAFLKMVVNGQIIALLLRQYNIITEEQLKSIQLMTDSQLIASRVTMWLKTLDPSLEEDAVNCFVKCRLSSTVKLFYRLYLALKGKDQLHFAAQNISKARMRSTNARFQCSRVVEGVEDLAAFGPHPLSQPLQDNYNIIQWHKDRYRELLQKCKEARNAYLASLDTQEKKPMDTFFRISLTSPKTPEVETFDAQSLCETYDELKEQEKKAQGMEIVTPNPKLAEKIVKRLKHKFKQDQEERAMKAQMETILVTKIWNEAVRQQEQDIEMELSKKILKQSMYEKKMASKIFEIREQKHIMAENRNLIQKEIQKQMDDALLEYVFVKEKQAGEERYRYYMERDRTLELHRRIYEEQQRLLRERRRTMCNDVVKDLVDMSIKEGEYKETFTEDMSPKMKKDLAALFVEGKSIFDVVEDIETIIDYVPLMDYDDEIMLEEIDRQNTVDIRNFEDYCNFLWPYEIEQHAPDFLEDLDTITLGMNILGHIIFRLLLAKYPKPPLPTPPDIPKVEAAVCISNIPDFTILPTLEKLLQERKIKVIQLEEAINYCLDAYKNEITTEAPESQFVDETQAAVKEAKKKKGAKEKKRKKDPPAKGQKPSKKKGKQKKKGESYVEAEEASPFRDEMVETPRIFPCEEQQLSQKADLGRLAYEVLNLGEPLSDEILVKMFVEYLKTLSDVYGWVLVNYPQNFPQAMLLEEALTAKKVPVSQSKTLEPQNIEVAPEGITELTTEDFAEEEEEIIETIVGTVSDMDERTTTFSASAMLQTQTQSKSDRKSVSFPNEPIPHPEPQTELILSVEISTVNTAGTKIEDLAELTIRTVKQNTIDSDKNAEFRVSLLLTNPDVIPPEEDYDSYLTALIVLKQDVESLANPHVVDMDNEDNDSLTPLDIFYQNQGCYYTLYYKTLDFSAIKHLGKLIVGEYSIPPKSSVQIFGDTVLYLEADVIQPDTANETKALKKGKKKEKKEKPKATSPKDDKSKEGDKKKGKEKSDKKSKKDKKEKKEKKDKGGDGDKKSKKDKGSKKGKKGKIKEGAEVMIERADKQTQIPTPEPESVVEFIEIPEPVPGTKEYVYVDLPIPDFFEVCLATLWENVEEVYVYDFRELFFRKRLVWGAIVPYMDFVRRYMTDYIARPDEKQIHIFNFQRIYNSIDEDLRGDDEMKSELHCRVYEFREKLWEICDQRMRDAENERNNIIVQDWLAKQACELTSIYVTSMQLEIDRCADTMQLLNDYYTVMVTKMPCQAEILEKTLLHQVCLSAYMDFDDAVTYKEFVRNMLKDCDFALEETPYHNAIGKDLSTALEFANTYEDTSKKEIAKIEATVYPGKKAKPMKDTKQVKNEKRWPKFTDPEPEVREQGPKLVVEWRAVITAEKLRTDLRLNMLMSLFKEDLRDMFNCGIKTFHGLYNDVKDRYERELKSVEVCCSVLSRAIEEEVPIQPQLVLKGDTFYIDPNVMLFEDPLPMEEEIIVEYEQPETFTINQLEKFVTTLTKYAPKGIIAEQAFLFMLQDMIVYTPEDGGISAVPELWKKLSYKSMNKLAYEFFGYTAKIDWRDFVLYNLCISFPTEEELMYTRRQFRELDEDSKEYVFDYQYDSVEFWYEKEFDKTNPQDLNRLNKIKKILFKMYLLDNERVNYTMLLLGFCKGTTTPEGVAKALALSLGKLVCHQQDIGEAFVETLREQKKLEMEEELLFQIKEKEKLDTVASVIDSLIDTTVHECDSCYLIELDANEPTKTKDPSEPQERVSLNDAFISESMDYLDRLVKSYGPVDMYEEEYYGGFLHEEFSNVEIGYEAYKNPPLVYYLLYDIIFTVMMASMPWRAEIANVGETSFRQELEKVYESTKNHEFDDVVLTHEFLNSVQFAELMNHINKFKIINPRKVIRGLLGESV